jgi:ABC-2 type transport system permease protein
MEGRSWWLLKAAPVTGAEVLRGKFLSTLLPFIAASSILMFGISIASGFEPGWALYGWFGVEMLGAGMLAIGVGLAVPWAQLNWDDPRKMSTWQSSLLSLVAWVALGLVGGGMLCLPVLAQLLSPGAVPFAALMGAVLVTVLSAGAGWLALQLGIRRIGSVGEA